MQNQLALSGERIVEKFTPTISSCWYDSWRIFGEGDQPKYTAKNCQQFVKII